MFKVNDVLKWNEPIWAAPNKPRGKRDKIGEQEVTGRVTTISDVIEFEVLGVQKVSDDESQLTVVQGDIIKRKKLSLEKGNCQIIES